MVAAGVEIGAGVADHLLWIGKIGSGKIAILT